MQKVGVEAVVEGLGAFIGDVGSINRALDQLRPQGTLLQRMFEGVTGALGSFGREILNVVEHALGHLLAEAIQFVIQKLGELISATIEAGSQFQIMQLRLNRLNMNDIIKSGVEYTDIMGMATTATKDQIQWIQKLAIQTPYDAQDIANVFTMARTYGFADQMARDLTVTVTDFTASMGLGDVEMRRILKNFGQMIQLGKITQRELNDLAVGAMVPVNDVLARMQSNLGLTSAELDDFKKTGEGVNAFFQAFSQIVEERASGAARDMARTFKGASDNAKDFIKSILGFNVVTPILDVLGAKIADTLSALTSPRNFDMINRAAERLGMAFSKLLSDLLGGGEFNADSLVAGITKGLDKMTGWILKHGPEVKNFFKNIGDFIRSKVTPIIDGLVEKFNLIKDWVIKNKELISGFFKTLGSIISEVFGNLFGGGATNAGSGGGGLEGFLEGVKEFMQMVIDNKEKIAEWATIIAKVVFWFQVGATILGFFMSIIIAILSPILALLAILAGLVGIWAVLGGVITAVAGFIISVLVPAILIGIAIFIAIVAIILIAVATLWILLSAFGAVKAKIEEFVAGASERFGFFRDDVGIKFEETKSIAIAKATELWDGVREKFTDLLAGTRDTVSKVAAAFNLPHWGAIGRAIIEGVEGGVYKAAAALIASVVRVIQQAYDAAMNAIQAFSPSRLFARVGKFSMLGVAKGVEDNAKLAVGAMEDAVGAMAAPALGLPAIVQQYSVGMGPTVSSSINTTNNFSLTVNSGAPTEPILSDYNMMQSLVQG